MRISKQFKRSIVVFFWASLSVVALAQDKNIADTKFQKNQYEIDDFIRKLPPIETFIDSALTREPLVGQLKMDIKKQELELSLARKNWAKDIIGGSAGINYGKFDNLVISKDLGLDQLNTSAGEQTRYSVGLSMKIPIATLFDKSNVKRAKIDLEKLDYTKQSLIKKIRDDVYIKYNELISSYQKYMILIHDFDSYDAFIQQAEKDFYRNQKSLSEVLNLKMNRSKAQMDLLDAKNNFQKAVWEIQELCGIEIKY